MIFPSIDLEAGRTVQLVGGEELAVDAGDPRPIFDGFARSGEVAVIDLDAAKGEGDNKALVEELVARGPCRVGGGIRSVERARELLDAGAQRIIIGSAARPEFLRQLPRERLVAAVDGRDGEVVTHGWRKKTGVSVASRVRELRDDVDGFLVTFVESEGRRTGLPMDRIDELVDAAGSARLCVAGGVARAEEVAILDAKGVDVQVGMGLYQGDFDIAACIFSMLKSEREDGLVPTIVCDPYGVALGLTWSSEASLRAALSSGRGVYQSRKRGLWKKGESSGATQELLRVSIDCDRDALRFLVRQGAPGFCHRRTQTCFDDDLGVGALERRLHARLSSSDDASYVRRLAREEGLLESKLREEAGELAEARGPEEVAHEAADLFFFLQMKLTLDCLSFEDVERELRRRALRVTRRGGDAKDGER